MNAAEKYGSVSNFYKEVGRKRSTPMTKRRKNNQPGKSVVFISSESEDENVNVLLKITRGERTNDGGANEKKGI